MSYGPYGVKVEEAVVRLYITDNKGRLARVLDPGLHQITPWIPWINGFGPDKQGEPTPSPVK